MESENTHDWKRGDTSTKPTVWPPQEKLVDTNGAGDAFVGGFLAALAKGKDMEVPFRGNWLDTGGLRGAVVCWSGYLGVFLVILVRFFFGGYDIWPTFDVTNWRVRNHKPCGHFKCPQPMGFGFSECYPPSLHLHFNSIYSGQNILLGINISIHIPYSRHFCVDDFFFSPDGIC